MIDYYKMDKEGNVIPVGGLEEYMEYLTKEKPNSRDRIIKQECVADVWISTVFLMIDHAWSIGNGTDHKPVVFETMVFKKDFKYDQEQERYTSIQDARAGHKKWVDLVKKEFPLWKQIAWKIYWKLRKVGFAVREMFTNGQKTTISSELE